MKGTPGALLSNEYSIFFTLHLSKWSQNALSVAPLLTSTAFCLLTRCRLSVWVYCDRFFRIVLLEPRSRWFFTSVRMRFWVVSCRSDKLKYATQRHRLERKTKSQLSLTLQWRHNRRHGVSNHQSHDCLLSGLLGCRSKKISKPSVTGLCAGNSPVTDEFLLRGRLLYPQCVSNAGICCSRALSHRNVCEMKWNHILMYIESTYIETSV